MNKVLLLVATVATVSMPVSYAQDLQPFDRMDVFELEWVSSPQISPDGKHIVYVRNGMDVMTDGKLSRLWLIGQELTASWSMLSICLRSNSPPTGGLDAVPPISAASAWIWSCSSGAIPCRFKAGSAPLPQPIR